MNVSAKDLLTGDVIIRHAGIVIALQHLDGGAFPDQIEVTLANAIETFNRDGHLPGVEFIENRIFRYRDVEKVDVIRDRPLPNGMHMTQFDCRGMCHGRAHPRLAEQLRAEGRMVER